MKEWRCQFGGGLASLHQTNSPEPTPGPGQVVVHVQATSLNYRELSILRGSYPLPVKPDLVPVSDGAGEVVEVGPGVTNVRPGDRVLGVVFPRWAAGPFTLDTAAQLGGSLNGMLTEYALLEATGVLPVPPHLSYAEAATLPCAAVTAWHALTAGRPVPPGGTLLTVTSGMVSLFAIQLGHVAGLRVLATTRSADKASRLKQVGADDVINTHQSPEWSQEVDDLTRGRGVDRVVHIGPDLDQSLRSIAIGQEVELVGLLAAGAPPIDPGLVFARAASVRAIALGSRSHTRELLRAVGHAGLRPVIDREFSFDQAVEAFTYYDAQEGVGKVVIRP